MPVSHLQFPKFETRAPSPQNAVDLLRGKWYSDLSQVIDVEGTGACPLFKDHPFLRLGVKAISRTADGRLDGETLLELGSFEGGHTYQLEQFGAIVTGVEANAEAYLKGLIVKEVLGMRTRFLHGDITAYLESIDSLYDIIFCCGVLYHQSDPIHLVNEISRHTDRCVVWTHHYAQPLGWTPITVERHGFAATYHSSPYPEQEMAGDRFLGGNRPERVWMEQQAIVDCFKHFDFNVTLLEDMPDHVNGPAFLFSATR